MSGRLLSTLKSERYTAPISLSATTTLKAMAIAPSFAKSPSVRGKYVVKSVWRDYPSLQKARFSPPTGGYLGASWLRWLIYYAQTPE